MTFLSLGCTERPAAQKFPNIVLTIADDQGWGDLSGHGNPNLQTPNLDRLAREGTQFAHFFVNPVCSPTRAALLTGRYAPRGGVYDTSEGGERLNPDEITFATYFQQAGYLTACYGKWHNGQAVKGEGYLQWQVEVLEEGQFEAMRHHACPEQPVGATLALEFMGQQLTYRLQKAHDPPLRGMEHDRCPRQEPCIKDFLGVPMGTLYLPRGAGPMTLKALSIPAGEVMDFRMFTFKRIATP